MIVDERKKELRKRINKRIKELDPGYCLGADQIIFEGVIALEEYKKAGSVFCFVSAYGEPNTRPIIANALQEGKTVGVPKCLNDSIMEVYKITSLDDLVEGMYGIMEPKEGLELLNPKDIDFALIPCVTCNQKGDRLGHGKGYYDRYLEKGDFYTCMICRNELMEEDIPVTEHDIRPQIVISDFPRRV